MLRVRLIRRVPLVSARSLSRSESIKILGLESDFTKKDIKKAYIQKSKRYHPEKDKKRYRFSRNSNKTK